MKHKVCFIGTEITPSDDSSFVGGHVNTAVALSKGLSKLGWKIHIVTTPSRFLKNANFKFPWAEFHLIKPKGSYSSLEYSVDFFIKAIKLMENINWYENFDLIHCHSGYFGAAILPAVAKKKLSIPALFSLYCPVKLLPKSVPGAKYAIRFLSEGLDKIIAVTNNVKKSLLNYGVRNNKIELIPLCFDDEIFNHSFLSDNLDKTDYTFSKTILFVGNVDKAKGIDIFLKAARLVLQKYPNVKFMITLHEPYKVIQNVKTFASHLLGTAVEIKGVVRNMAKLMASVDIVVVPFRSTEGISDIPLVVLEAMAIGKPVIATRVGGVTEVIRDRENGLLVKTNDVPDLANAIITLLEDPGFINGISKNAILSAKCFQSTEVSKKLNALYLKIIDNKD
ncbi:MAG: glycosyltransferase family 4 protein [Candidatus Verstraetearchaeota archaeon]|nr:glycosyltransferase family 4 protein [Candidatus Verstraetearchaeota archaeon]